MSEHFTLKEKRDLPELKSTGHLYEHASGAKIVYLANEDTNKVFNVMFRTPCHDDTGLPHILEHCVLNGSEKYPTKDPFGTLMKGSLVTFLNAMTYPDATMYPVASYNDKDFLNLMGVYLDSVYKPLVHRNEFSFLQEGWHYDLETPEGELGVNGVVYNEMKGAFSAPARILYQKVLQTMFPESYMRFSSGGDPDNIPELSYEAFKDFHKTLYHPANSYIYLYGKIDEAKCFALLDEYLCGAEDRTAELKKLMDKPNQTPFAEPVFAAAEYAVGESDDPAGKNYIGAAFALPSFPDAERFVAIEALNHILMNTPASPLRNGLLEKGIGESVEGWASFHAPQPMYSIHVQNSAYDAAKLREAVFEILNRLVEGGLDKVLVEACLNVLEFRYRENDAGRIPIGLIYCISNMPGWFYGKNPLDYTAPVEAINAIRAKAGKGYFENLIKELFLENNFSGFVTLNAVPGLQAIIDEKRRDKFAAHKAEMSDDEIKAVIDKKKELTAKQNTPDTPEAIASIPIVELSDIDQKAGFTALEERGLGGFKAFYAPLDTRGIAYNQLIFDLRCLDESELPLAGLLIHLLGKLDTKRRGFAELNNEVNMHLGGFECRFNNYLHRDGAAFLPVFEVMVKALEGKIPEVYSLASEILTETLFTDANRLKMLISEAKAKIEANFVTAGHQYAIIRAWSYLGDRFAYRDPVEGYAYYEYLKDLLSGFDGKFEAFSKGIAAVCKKLFNAKGLTSVIACGPAAFDNSSGPYRDFNGSLAQDFAAVKANLTPKTKNEAFAIESQVSYAVEAFGVSGKDYPFNGAMRVAENIVSEGYLLQEIRVKGGAYGYGITANPSGVVHLMSYRDPHVQRTYDTYKSIPAFLGAFNPSDREMLQYVLGAVNVLDRPLLAKLQMERATAQFLTGTTAQTQQRERDELLAANAAQIRGFAGLFGECMKEGVKCVFGAEGKVNECKDMFERIVKV